MKTTDTTIGRAKRRTVPARDRHPAPPSQRGAEIITVAGSTQAVRWLSQMSLRTRSYWRVRELGRGMPSGVLVLPQPEDYPQLLRHWTGIERAVVSLDCPEGRTLALSKRVPTFTFSEGRDCADLTAKDLRLTADGLRFVAVTRTALTRVCVQPEDLYPALAAMACAVWLGADLDLAAEAVSVPAASARGKIIQMA